MKNVLSNLRFILPWLLSKLTGKGRYLPPLDFNWRGNVVHSLLMCYYALFWRRWGIQHGGLSYYQDSTGKRKVWVTSPFGYLLFLEHEIIRKWNWQFKLVKVPVPQLAFAGGASLNPKHRWVLMSIGFDQGFTASGTSTSPAVASVAPAGANRWMGTHLNFGAGTSVSAVPAFGGSNHTIISSEVNTADGNPFLDLYRLIAPTTSSGSVTATLANSVFWTMIVTTYTGIDQTTSTAAENKNASPWTDGTPKTYSATSDLNGSWIFLAAKQDSAGTSFTVDSPSQLRKGEDASPINMIADGATDVNSASSGNIVVNWTGGAQRIGVIYCMIRPAAAAVGGRRRMMVGMGS